jgi:exosome complex component RRP4
MRDDKVDLVPTYESVKRPMGPDGKPLPREIVVPGETIAADDHRPGLGSYRTEGQVISATLGIKNVDNTYASVIPLGGQYIPRVGDVVIGQIEDVGPSNWLIEINSPYPAPMHVNEVPWHVEFGETTDYMKAGDAVIVRVARVTEVGRVQVSMEGPGLRKLQGGHLIDIPHSKVPRVIGTKGSMISLIKKYTACRLVVGQNGRIWIDGDAQDILIAMGAIQMIADQSHVHGLTNNVKTYLQKAKGIDPEKEAEEERKQAEEERKRAEEERKRAEEQQAERDKKRQEQKERKKAERLKKEKAEKKVEEEDDEFDEFYDSNPEDELCKDDSTGGDGIVTILAPDGESLMVVDEEELPECEPEKKEDKKKEGQ